MTIKEGYDIQYGICIKKNLPVEIGGHYRTRFEFGNDPVYVNPDGSDVVCYVFNVSGCVKRRKDGRYFHRDRLPVFGRISGRKVRRFIYKYLLFLKCDGITDPDMMKLYTLHLLVNKLQYYTRDHTKKGIRWKQYTPVYKNVGKLIDSLIAAAIKKEIDEETRNRFSVVTRCKVNPYKAGMVRKNRREILKDAHRGVRSATDSKIRNQYDQNLTIEENALKIGVSTIRIKEWKADHPDNWESKEERIRRMYDPSKGKKENARIIGVSLNTLKKYLPEITEEIKEEVEQKDEDKEFFDGMTESELDKWIEDSIDDWDFTH